MAITSGGRWDHEGGTSSGSYTNILGGSGGVVTWSIVGSGFGNGTTRILPKQFSGTVRLDDFLPVNYESLLRQAFDMWAAAADIEFIQVADEGGNLGGRPYPSIRIAGGYIDGSSSTLGFGFYPATHPQAGDILLDSSDTRMSEAKVLWLALHEIGHALGVKHSTVSTAVMNSFFNGATSLQPDDIEGIRTIYGAQDSSPNSYFLPFPQADIDLIDAPPDLSIYGSIRGNRIDGTLGRERIFGAEGDDTLIGRLGSDLLDGGAGVDTVEYSFSDHDFAIDLVSGSAVDLSAGGTDTLVDIENLVLGKGDDTIWLTASSTDNRVDGGAGFDVVHLSYLFGAGYTLSGDADELVITGSAGVDTLTGVEAVTFADGTTLAPEELIVGTVLTGTISVSDAMVTEGDDGTKIAIFTLYRVGGNADVSADFFTQDGSATVVGGDYLAASGTLSFSSSINQRQVQVNIVGDTAFEDTEAFSLVLANPANGVAIGDSLGIAVILDDDKTGPEVTVTCYGENIGDDDLTPDLANFTTFQPIQSGATTSRTFTVSNEGDSSLTISNLKLPNGFVLVEGLSSTIAPGQFDTFRVEMIGKKVGAVSGIISFTTNDTDEATYNFAVTAAVKLPPAPRISVSGSGVEIAYNDRSPSASDLTDFGTPFVLSEGVVHTFTVTNVGEMLLTGRVEVPSGFTLVDGGPLWLEPGEFDTFAVRMDTNYIGERSGLILVGNSDPDKSAFYFAIRGKVAPIPVIGTAGDDLLFSTGFAEPFFGATGSDTVSYDVGPPSVTASLSDPRRNTGSATGDTYDSIENVIGTTGKDSLTGNSVNNVLEGADGADKLDGGSTSKTDIDTASYAHAGAAVAADLLKAANNQGEAQGDTYKNIENLLGSAFGDMLTGNTAANTIDGGDGNDLITGSAGIDTLTGGLGADMFKFVAPKDGGGATGDLIIDFVSGEDSIGVLRAGFKIATTLADVDFAAHYFVSAVGGAPSMTNPSGVTATETGHGQFLFNETTNQLWWDLDGSGKAKAVLLATFHNAAHVTATDFDLL